MGNAGDLPGRDAISHFTDLYVWQLARVLVRDVYELTRRSALRRDLLLRDQLLRSAISISSNIAEGFERGGNREFIHFLSIAKGSAGELESQLFLALDQGYIATPELEQLRITIRRIAAMLHSLMKRLRESSYRGRKFREA
ncbi:MAG: four helix bundle protein [Acidobacteriota bacterium]